ncbi:hypothetical protein [Methylobacter svalbardensis]|uniref:hypothetical protein n=1 Tax=Methylobacter svalbardensis TaxID=3080016 RepID=UPI0030ED011C
MTFPNNSAADEPGCERTVSGVYPSSMNAIAVSWGAIVAGAAATAALALILLMLGVGLGLSSVSPWAYSGVSATTFGVSSILWLTFTQLVASGMGGYLAGRLRTRWVGVHTDEVYFRDTAHGFLSWAIAALATAVLLTSVIGSIVSGGIQAGGVATTAATVTTSGVEGSSETTKWEPMGYSVDWLFRKDINASATVFTPDESGAMPRYNLEPITAGSRSEVARIFMNSIRTGPLPAEDTQYVGQIVVQHTGLTQLDAEKRVIDTYTRIQTKLREAETAAKEATDSARKAFIYASLWLFISLLIGAFVASFAAIYGGRQRDL